jgi:acyl CoA:acetate/3-ketoacid CoA transferase beta subunit
VVDRIYTNLAVIDVTSRGFQVSELSPGVKFEEVQAQTGALLLKNREGAMAGRK